MAISVIQNLIIERKYLFTISLSIFLITLTFFFLFTTTTTSFTFSTTSSNSDITTITTPPPTTSTNITDQKTDNTTSVVVGDPEALAALQLQWKACKGSAMVDYIPCLDNLQAIKALKSRRHMEHRERHCPVPGPKCLVPLPVGYKAPILWPQSRDMVIVCF